MTSRDLVLWRGGLGAGRWFMLGVLSPFSPHVTEQEELDNLGLPGTVEVLKDTPSP